MSFGAPVRNGIGIGLRASTSLSTRGGAGGGLNVATVFATSLYTGNSSTQTITNGIDLAGEGGLVWIKNRNTNGSHLLYDTARGVTKSIYSNSTYFQETFANSLTSFNSNGFSLGSDPNAAPNLSGRTYASWTFREAPNFFDVVTWTGNGVAGRQIAHNLGVAPGMILVKRTDNSSNWAVYHRSSNLLILNNTAAAYSTAITAARFGDDTNVIAPTNTVFTVGGDTDVNASGGTYVAYLFAHDATADGIIQCGSYAGTGAVQSINLGWTPQWLLVKNVTNTGNWNQFDTARGMATSNTGSNALLNPNLSNAETTTGAVLNITATGFTLNNTNTNYNGSGENYIYVAIRSAP